MKSFSMMLKPLALSVALLSILAVSSSEARADEVTIAGYTNGCFNGNVGGGCVAGVPPNTSATQTASLFGLSFVNSTIQSGTTVNGFRAIGGNPIAPPTQNSNNLGAFNLANTQAVYNGNTFTLRVTFTAPTGISGGGSELFSATLVGSVLSNGNGGVQIDFDNSPRLFTFSSGSTSGSFTFSVNDLALDPGQTGAVTGQITAAQQNAIPEPTTMLLLGTGLAGVAARIRKRRKSA